MSRWVPWALPLAAAMLLPSGAGAREPDSATVALWLFDEQRGIYPSNVLSDASASDFPLVLGLSGAIAAGRFGNALEVQHRPRTAEALDPRQADGSREGLIRFGLLAPERAPGRKAEPLTWRNAQFAALMTAGENHLRKEVGFANPTDTRLNLGGFDWTVEFWYRPASGAADDGVVFEVGTGPRGENNLVTRLALAGDRRSFTLFNQPSDATLTVPTAAAALDPARGEWHHFAFVYDAGARQLRHYVDGKQQALPPRAALKALAHGDEAYLTVGRDALWRRPLAGRLDELRVSSVQRYTATFTPASFAPPHRAPALAKGPSLLFDKPAAGPVELGSRKHLFIDDALVQRAERVTFTANPPRPAELVIADIQGPFRKHVSVIEGDDGLVRLYNGVDDDRVEVHVSRDGVHFTKPETGQEYKSFKNIAVDAPTATGSVFIDPNAPPGERWKYVSGFHDRGTYIFSSPDGYRFRRHPTAVLPLHVGSQANVFWDEQRGTYVGYHRSDCHAYPSGTETRRVWVMTETTDPTAPWPFTPVPVERVREIRQTTELRDPQPWFMDNGPLTPGGFCKEYPTVFGPRAGDPPGTDVYVPKALKYPYAPDVYLAFPTMYFHYWDAVDPARQTLGDPERGLGSGPIDTQLEVSRNAVDWRRYARPAYIGIGRHEGYDVVQSYIAHGMVRRGNEIWQYYFGTEEYHSTQQSTKPRRGVFRVVQRLDGFVSADAPYDTTALMVTKPLVFKGNRLVLNIDTEATGYVQVGLLDENGRPIPGYSVDDGVYINGDFIDKEVEWLGKGTNLSAFEGRPVQLVFRMRGSKLYAMQFAQRADPAVGVTTEPVDTSRFGAVRYVSQRTGSDESGDGSPRRPWQTVGHALGRVTDASTARPVAILVAAGQYREPTLTLKPHVSVYGGYDPATWSRDVTTHRTVLDGEGRRRIAVAGPDAALDGFVLRNGRVRGPGGALLIRGTSPVVSNSVFENNTTLPPEPFSPKAWHETAHDGGAIACLEGCSAVIRNNVFVGNTTSIGRGGALACDNETARDRRAAPRVLRNVFLRNVASVGPDTMRSGDGGAISFYGYCDGQIAGNVIAENGAPAKNDGGGVFLNLWAAPAVTDNIFTGNHAGDDAGALFIGGQKHHYGTPLDPVPAADDYFVRVERNVFMGNRNGSPTSGAMRVTMMTRGRIADNVTAENPGGVHTQRSELVLAGNTFTEGVLYEDEERAAPGPTVFRNNILLGARRWDAPVSEEGSCTTATFLPDGVDLRVRRAQHDAARHVTTVEVQGRLPTGSLAGRVVQAGDRWGVVRSGTATVLEIWGDFPATRITVKPTYRVGPGSSCAGRGAANPPRSSA
jgi:hypothetical protein